MKILVDVYVPVIMEHFDVLIPDFISIGDVLDLIVNAVKDTTNKMFVVSGNEIICHFEKNTILSSDSIVNSLGVNNGDHLILI